MEREKPNLILDCLMKHLNVLCLFGCYILLASLLHSASRENVS